ncbi:hypothetical protein POM88_041835 [Heracleum sosnowskyi]|uniref:MGS-like domain-containing protein n=1 Tax=Heracleum sosnowskyi TaxID=360622 RepID=A0AAD8MB41_9APIA|nr:hypothetical protein POM88_041835 [Heracleum sosnowskyi]
MLDGRVKTLHPNIHGGILARRDQSHHMEALHMHGIGTFDVVIVNLYPFYNTVSSTNEISFEDGIEKIDIGGPVMIRAAAKNHKDVLVVVDSKDYPELLESLRANKVTLRANKVNEQFRRKLAWKAFQHVASYDSAVSEWLWKQTEGDKFPPSLTVPISLTSSLRYGENPHQKAAFYADKSLTEFSAGDNLRIPHSNVTDDNVTLYDLKGISGMSSNSISTGLDSDFEAEMAKCGFSQPRRNAQSDYTCAERLQFSTSLGVMDYSLLVVWAKQEKKIVYGIIDYLMLFTYLKQGEFIYIYMPSGYLATWISSTFVLDILSKEVILSKEKKEEKEL